MRRPNPILQKMVWDKYAPEGRDVLWVGSFLDGLVHFVADDLFPDIPVAALDVKRRKIKGLFADVRLPRRPTDPEVDEAATHYRSVRILMSREGWPVDELLLSSRIVNAEYGTITNSPQKVEDLETGEVRYEPAPIILLDKRYGLHYLLRGDRILFDVTLHNQARVHSEYRLRPKSEGSSLVIPEATEQLAVL